MTKDRNFYLFEGPKWPKNGASEAHTFKSTCNEHVKQYCCETSENFFWESDQTPEIWLTLGPKITHKLGLWGPYILHISESSSNKHIKQD